MPSKVQQRYLLASAVAGVAAAIRIMRRRNIHVPPQPLPSDFPVTPADVVDAAKRVRPHVHRTPVLTCSGLDELAGRSLKFKCEVFQRTGSFKIRGATNAALQAPENAPLVTHSSGNHAQALALAARSTGREAHVVMPRTAPQVKRAAVRRGVLELLCVGTACRVHRVAGVGAVHRDGLSETGGLKLHKHAGRGLRSSNHFM